MSKLVNTAGKTATAGATTRKGKANTDKANGRARIGKRSSRYVAADLRGDWADGPKVTRSFVTFEMADGKRAVDTLDACAVAMGLRSRSDAMAALLADRLREPINANVTPDEVNGGYFNVRCMTYAVAHIGGTGWRKFRAEGIARRMSASELAAALVEEASVGLAIKRRPDKAA